jgi:hypothetical protein
LRLIYCEAAGLCSPKVPGDVTQVETSGSFYFEVCYSNRHKINIPGARINIRDSRWTWLTRLAHKTGQERWLQEDTQDAEWPTRKGLAFGSKRVNNSKKIVLYQSFLNLLFSESSSVPE